MYFTRFCSPWLSIFEVTFASGPYSILIREYPEDTKTLAEKGGQRSTVNGQRYCQLSTIFNLFLATIPSIHFPVTVFELTLRRISNRMKRTHIIILIFIAVSIAVLISFMGD